MQRLAFLRQVRLDQDQNVRNELGQVDGLFFQADLAAFNPRHVEYFVDQIQQMLGSQADFIQAVRHFLRFVQMRLRDRRHSDNPVHRRADIMRHRREKDGAGLVVFLRLPQCVGQILAHVMLRRRFVQNGEILIGVNRNEINLNPSLQLVCGTLLIFTALPLVQLTV